jgi:hypothetical protein
MPTPPQNKKEQLLVHLKVADLVRKTFNTVKLQKGKNTTPQWTTMTQSQGHHLGVNLIAAHRLCRKEPATDHPALLPLQDQASSMIQKTTAREKPEVQMKRYDWSTIHVYSQKRPYYLIVVASQNCSSQLFYFS